MKQDKQKKIRGKVCSGCGKIRRIRRLPLHQPKETKCDGCLYKRENILFEIIIGAIGGGLLAIYIRLRLGDSSEPFLSLKNLLSVLIGAILFLFFIWVEGGKYNHHILRDFIKGIAWGGGTGFIIWNLEFFYSSSLFNLFISISAGIIIGVLYFLTRVHSINPDSDDY
ncbi:MAG: hypothetical protein AB1757_19055 [Acidobacteriota bacterium]